MRVEQPHLRRTKDSFNISKESMISVIGGSGFVGSRFCKRLRDKEVSFEIGDKSASRIFTKEWKKLDVCDIESLSSLSPQIATIVNLAAEHRDDVRPWSLYDDVNVDGARNICAFADERGVNRIVFTSSVAVYGFAKRGTDESGAIDPFNHYGRTKYQAEQIYEAWQAKDPANRSLVIIRPTVIFGEQNRGNVYNLLRQIASGTFVMIGDGENRKSMAYVENVAAFIEHCCDLAAGIHIYNYIDKPDFAMNSLIKRVRESLGQNSEKGFRIPYVVGLGVGFAFDVVAKVTGRQFPINSIRIKKFCKDSVYNTSLAKTGFVAPVDINQALEQTIKYEFLDKIQAPVFYTE